MICDDCGREERHGDKYIMGEIGELLVELGLAKKRRCNAARKPKEEAAS
ncbi:hypothetical protein SEA_EJIMIX_187 [Mycobacterium phage Ejimix]|nr:hypothetical protein SEA_EJIMIX_187 [Mycobacterium phage Ejimix]QBI97638.1 hypothetical protein SEA_HUGHESYANG_196 [Mycobacterium phage Hughesyang]QBI99817.1 hypothetical protein SEA_THREERNGTARJAY_197 [Mycobacterium phage ThreeRngTarjay]QCO93880.1 hypothetical protein SEA_SCHATZIE_192 [Mycobacterium phage Schatzie]